MGHIMLYSIKYYPKFKINIPKFVEYLNLKKKIFQFIIIKLLLNN